MSYPLDTAAQNAALDALLSGDTSGLPSSWEVALYDDDPRTTGVELTSTGGYVRPVVTANLTNFPAAVAGSKTSVDIAFADPSGPWSSTARFAVLVDHGDSTTRWFFGPLLDEIAVLVGDETDISVAPTVFWNVAG